MGWFTSTIEADFAKYKADAEAVLKEQATKLEAAVANASTLAAKVTVIEQTFTGLIADAKSEVAALKAQAASYQALATQLSGGFLTAANEISALKAALGAAGISIPAVVTTELTSTISGT